MAKEKHQHQLNTPTNYRVKYRLEECHYIQVDGHKRNFFVQNP